MRLVVIILVTLAMIGATVVAVNANGYWILSGVAFICLLITMGVVSWDDGAPVTVWAAYSFALALVSAVIWPIVPSVVLVVGWRRSRETSKPIDGPSGPGVR